METKNILLPYLDDFLLHLQSDKFSRETLYSYERDLEVFQGFLQDAGIEFDKINKKTILNYKAYLSSDDRKTSKWQPANKELSSYSINKMLSALRSYVKFLIKIDYQSPIAPSAIELVKKEKKQPRVAEFDEIVKLIESPTLFEKNELIALRNRAILEMFFSTGMRISELVNLKIAQINKAGQIFILGKGKKERFVYLTPRAAKCLKKYLEIRGDFESPYVFIPYRGKNIYDRNKKLSPNYLQEKIKRYRELLGLNIPISPHGLRRAFATYMSEKGASAAAIQILLGHESLGTTTRYVNLSVRYAEKVHRKYHPLKE